MALGSIQPLTEMSTRNISWCVGLTTLPPSCAECLEIWAPRHVGTLWACNGITLPFSCILFDVLFNSKEPKNLEKSCKFLMKLYSRHLRKSCFNLHCIHTNKRNLRPLLCYKEQINPLKKKRRLLYLKAQFVPRSKHF